MRALLVVLAVLTAAASAVQAEIVDRVLAVVGQRVITLSDARAAVTFGLVEPAVGADAVAEGVAYLVNRQLMLSEVDRYGVPPPGPDARFQPRGPREGAVPRSRGTGRVPWKRRR